MPTIEQTPEAKTRASSPRAAAELPEKACKKTSIEKTPLTPFLRLTVSYTIYYNTLYLHYTIQYTTVHYTRYIVHTGVVASVKLIISCLGDFFTYCDEDQDYWSGYFTTRPFMKGLTRTTQSVLRTGESLYVLERAIAGGSNEGSRKGWFGAIEKARSNLGIFQHHDGVTGM